MNRPLPPHRVWTLHSRGGRNCRNGGVPEETVSFSGTPYVYDPYGSSAPISGTPSSGDDGEQGIRLFQGSPCDPAAGNAHFRFRAFSPELAYWMQQDPAGYVEAENRWENGSPKTPTM